MNFEAWKRKLDVGKMSDVRNDANEKNELNQKLN